MTADYRVSQLEDKVARAQKDAGIWKRRYEKLLDQVQDYLTAGVPFWMPSIFGIQKGF